MRIFNLTNKYMIGLFAALLTLPAMGQMSTTDRMIKAHSDPDEFLFFEDDRKQVVSYKEERVVRICAGNSRHLVPLKVSYDGKTATLHADDCLRVEAKNVYLEPKEPLDQNWVIVADVDTLS